MKLKRSHKQIAAIVGSQALALALMVLGASALAQFYGLDGAAALASVGADPAVVDCPPSDEETTASSGLSLDFLDLSVGWPRR